MKSSGDTDVLIAGAGPTGLVLAVELLRYGVRCRVIDRARARPLESRATDIHARTLEIFRDLGIAEEIISRGKCVRAFNAFASGRRISQLDFHGIDTAYPFTVAIPQSETEAVLEARVRALGGTVERPVELVRFAQDGGGVWATLAHGDGEERVRCRRLVGADGVGSTVRRALGLPFEGISYPERYFVADVRLDWNLPDDEVHLFMTPQGFFNVVALPGERRGRILCDFPAEAGLEPSLQLFRDALAQRTGLKARVSAPSFMSSFRIQRRLVPRYRLGSVFLAGDAAHTCSPLLGQGMNVGIQDAHNLGWKLALSLGRAERSPLLDSYALERRPVARRVLLHTHLMHSVSRLGGRVLTRLRDAACSALSRVPPLRNEAAMVCAELGVRYASNAIVADGSTQVTAGPARFGERWARGPLPGSRAPCFEALRERERQGSAPRHALLLFAGEDPAPSKLLELARLAAGAEERYGEALRSRLIVRSPRPAGPPEARADCWVNDASGALHRGFSAASSALYVVRPDGFIGFRCLPARGDALFAHLDGTFRD